jgi:hypothetical protein
MAALKLSIFSVGIRYPVFEMRPAAGFPDALWHLRGGDRLRSPRHRKLARLTTSPSKLKRSLKPLADGGASGQIADIA